VTRGNFRSKKNESKNRENSITILPDELKDLKDLKVLDLAENNLLYLPYGLKEVELQAIWLSENQSKSLIQFRVYFDASVLSVI